MSESKALNILLLIAKILLIVFLLLSLVYYVATLLDAYIESLSYTPPENGISIDPYPLAFAFVLIFSVVTNAACALLALLGLILSLIYKRTAKRRQNILTFSTLLASPVVIQILILLLGVFPGVLF